MFRYAAPVHKRPDHHLIVLLSTLLATNACTGDDASSTPQSSTPQPRDASTEPSVVDGGKPASEGGASGHAGSEAGHAGTAAAGKSGAAGKLAETSGAGGNLAGASGAGRAGSASEGDVDAGSEADDDGGVTPPANDAGSGGPLCELAARTASAATSGVVWLVVDGSGSMLELLGTETRWNVMRSALMDASSGIVKQLEHDVHWGMMLFDGPNPGGTTIVLPDGGLLMPSTPPATTCPRTITVEPEADNFASIDSAYPNEPLGGSTPTDRVLDDLLTRIPSGGVGDTPISVVLATDGIPNDFCAEEFFPPDASPKVVAAVRALTARGVKTYVISLASDDATLTQHLNDVAAAGGTGYSPFLTENKTQLSAALSNIVSPDPACALQLDRAIALDQACTGTVTLEGKTLACNAADGFTLTTPTRLQLQGAACTTYKGATDTLQLSYPCSALR
ncbi:MAG: vWA domain-containing protein [Polyangiales bacterium]